MEQEEDQLSNLPKIILHNILSRLPEEDAARTSVLSKTWLDIWYTYPNLSFCDSQFIGKSIQPVEYIVGNKGKFLKFCDYVKAIVLHIVFCDTKIIEMFPNPMEDLPKKTKDFIDYVKSRLVRFQKQRLVIKEFKLSVKCFELSYMSEDVDLCLKLASESGVEVLELYHGLDMDEEGRGECYILPKSVIEVKSLTKLVLDGRIRVDQAFMNHSIKFFSLKELYLFRIVLEDEQAINHLISCCPLIEIITLMLSGGRMKSLSMHGLQKLKKVRVSGIKEVYIDETSSLKCLDYCHDCLDAPFSVDFIHCKYLKDLLLRLEDSTIITNKLFLELFPKFPFLESLDISHMQLHTVRED
ncbi:FBD-associated F-box protein [Trifolium repens]|nr:FBD-associated F-box protein [Trifolium repens]